MRACVLESIGHLTYKDVPTPCPHQGEVLVRVGACGICSSDYARVNKTGTYHFPTIPGHEIAGRVVEVGEGVTNDWIGKKVVVFPLIPCFECEACKSQAWAQCERYDYRGSRSDGGFAEYVSVPEWNVKQIPEQLSFEIAALAEPAAVALHAVKSIGDINSISLGISGSGTIALVVGLWAKHLGAKDVVVICRSQKKCEFVREFGLHSILESDLQNVQKFDAMFECVGSNLSIHNCITAVRSRGSVVLVGNPESDIVLPQKLYWKILRSSLKICGVWNSSWKTDSTDDWDDVIPLLLSTQKTLSKLITQKYKLSDSMKPFELLQPSSLMIKGMYVNE